MSPESRFKPKPKHLLFALGGLAFVLVAMALANSFGAGLSEKTVSIVTDVVIVCALALMFYNRKLRADEAKAAAEKKAAEEAGKAP